MGVDFYDSFFEVLKAVSRVCGCPICSSLRTYSVQLLDGVTLEGGHTRAFQNACSMST